MSQMFVPILTDVFNHWFAQGAIPGSITKGVITLLKKGGRYVWEDLDDYRPITLLNTVKDFGPGLRQPLATCYQRSNRIRAELCCERNIDLRQLAFGTQKPRWSIWISPRPSVGWTIGFWRWFWRPPDSNKSSPNGSAYCTTTPRWWCRWTGSIQRRSRSSGRSSRVAPRRLFSMSLLWGPCSVGLGMGRQIQLCAESFLLARSERRSLRTPMISLPLCPTDRT